MAKTVECMTAGEINKALDRLDRERDKLNTAFIDAGRGHERPSETMTKSDPLAEDYKRLSNTRSAVEREISRRYGPGAPSRLPKGFGPVGCKK